MDVEIERKNGLTKEEEGDGVFIPHPVKIVVTSFRTNYPALGAKIRPYIDMHAQKFEGADIRPKFGWIFRPGSKQQHEKGDNFCIWTPFLMILGSLESPQ
jgi:hypothetical protein